MFVCAYTVSHLHYPLPRAKLASLVKGSWIDGKAQALILLLSVCDTPTFFYLSNFSAVKTEGLLYTHQPLHPHNPSKTTSPLAPHHHTWLPCQRELDCDKAISYYKLQHSAISSTLISSLPYLSQD